MIEMRSSLTNNMEYSCSKPNTSKYNDPEIWLQLLAIDEAVPRNNPCADPLGKYIQ